MPHDQPFEEAPHAARTVIPLVVDLDGSLLRSDLLLETCLALVRSRPFYAFRILLWIWRGKAYLKARLARATDLDVSRLPYDPRLLDHLGAEKRAGRRLVLATASDGNLAQRVAAHLGLFDQVMASDGRQNLSRHAKRDALVSAYGVEGFDYIGNSSDDLAVWPASRHILVANPERGIERRAAGLGKTVERVWPLQRHATRSWLREMRIHQWAKNVLIFVPLVAAHRFTEADLLVEAAIAFLAFGLCASSVYLLNDLLDLADDRHHPSKRDRPFACGDLSIRSGLLVAPALLLLSLGLALQFLPVAFLGTLGAYLLLSSAYSLWLKRFLAVDVTVLALLYTLRIIAGATACGLQLTFWVLGFSIFIFLSLALVKRYSELRQVRSEGVESKIRGRGYYPGDLEMISSLGASSGYLSALVLALYVNDLNASALYRHPEMIWLACPLLLLWITRIWILTHRGEMHDDPVVFALKDRASLGIGLLFGLVFWAAT